MGFAGDPETSAASSIDVRRASHSALAGRVTELEQSLAASEARVVELERHRDMLKELLAEANAQHFDATMRAESAASTAMRDGMMEAARIADEYAARFQPREVDKKHMTGATIYAHDLAAMVARGIAGAARSRASSLPGGEGKGGDDDPYRPEMVEELLSLVGEPRPPVGTVEDGR